MDPADALRQRVTEERGTGRDARLRSVAAVLDAVTLLDRELRTLGQEPFEGRRLGRSQLAVLFLLARAPGPVAVSQLAGGLGITAGAVTQTIDGLRAAGLVSSTVNPADGRSRLLALTPAAAGEVAAFERRFAERMMPRFEALSDEELASLAQLLARLHPDSAGAAQG